MCARFRTLSLEQLGRKWSECGKKAGWALESEVHAIGDGAEWVGRKARELFGPKCRMLVDFYHVSDYLGKVGREHPELKGKRGWLKRQQNKLKKGNHRRVIGELKRLVEGGEFPDEQAPARCAHRYLSNRAEQLWYDEAIAKGRSIGSGLIEGSHRHVLQHRLKLSGAWWLPEHAEAMSQLRVLRANNRFHELFPLARVRQSKKHECWESTDCAI